MTKYTAVGQTPILPSTQFRKQTPTPEPHGGPACLRKHSLKLRGSHSWAFLSGFTTQVTQTAHCFLLPGFALYKIETTLCVCSEFSLDPQTSGVCLPTSLSMRIWVIPSFSDIHAHCEYYYVSLGARMPRSFSNVR